MILGANYAEYAELDKLNPHNPRLMSVSSRLLNNGTVNVVIQHF